LSRTRQRFEGTSIETALAAAVSSLGADLEVSEARKVRSRGLLGFFAREHFEVLAEPKLSGDTLAQAEANLDDTLQSLMARIEAEETPAAFAASLAAAAATTEAVEPPAPSAVPGPAPVEAPTLPPARPARPGEPQWSRATLRELGLYEGVLARVDVPDGAGDEEWTMALAVVLRAQLAAAEVAVPDGSVTVSGQGADAAVTMIRAAACGFPVDSLHLPSGDVPATAMELALAVRSCLPR
jgi:hypothetical protein